MLLYPAIYPIIDLAVTLRCNWKCRNCLRFCEMKDVTGLDYSDSDMTLGQIRNFISEVEALGQKKNHVVFNVLQVSGGEPLLHPQIVEIVSLLREKLIDAKLATRMIVNSNLVLSAPKEVSPYIINYSTVQQKPQVHIAALLHPDDAGVPRPTFSSCRYHSKWRVVLTYQGFSICCDSDGYIRLFGENDLIVDHLPDDENGFPLDKMDRVCQHCAFGYTSGTEKLEKDVGRPISKIYTDAAQLNHGGRITKVYPSKEQ
jgi:hypothetical protein